MNYYDNKGNRVAISDVVIGQGGRARILEASYKGFNLAAKVFHPRFVGDSAREKKVLYLASLYKKYPHLCAAMPLVPLYDEKGAFAGYLMRRFCGKPLNEALRDGSLNMMDRLTISEQILRLCQTLHKIGIVVGDLHCGNVMIDDSGVANVLDCDSFTVYDRKNRLGYPTMETLDFSPEVLNGKAGQVLLTTKSDGFMAASIVFQLLFGVHPLDDETPNMDRKETIAGNVRARNFAYTHRPGVPSILFYGEEMSELFCRTFEGPEDSIPTCDDYLNALLKIRVEGEGGFVSCPSCQSLVPALMACPCPNCGHSGEAATKVMQTNNDSCKASHSDDGATKGKGAIAGKAMSALKWLAAAALAVGLTFGMGFA